MLTKTIKLGLFLIFCGITGVIEARSRHHPEPRLFPRPVAKYVNDFAHILHGCDADAITDVLKNFDEQTGVEMSVVVIRSMSSFSFQAPPCGDEFARLLFNEWGIGEWLVNDGVLVLVMLDDRRVRIELGSGYPFDCNEIVQNIIDKIMLPRFKTENYSLGIYEGVHALVPALAHKIIPWWQRYALRCWKFVFFILIFFGLWYICFWMRVTGRGRGRLGGRGGSGGRGSSGFGGGCSSGGGGGGGW